MKKWICYELSNFYEFCKNFDIIMNIQSDCWENSCQLQGILANFNFFNICINYNEQHNGGWKSSINLKLVIFTIPCSTC